VQESTGIRHDALDWRQANAWFHSENALRYYRSAGHFYGRLISD